MARIVVLLGLVTLIPVVPFVLIGQRLEGTISQWVQSPASGFVFSAGVVLVLAADLFLPIPSSFVIAVAGMHLGPVLGAMVGWLGLTLGACLGFGIARAVGQPFAIRLVSRTELDRMHDHADRFGPWVLAVTRALPLLAESSVLVLGIAKLPWRRFVPPVALSNLGMAALYSTLGHFGRQYNAQWYALVAAIALPLLAATMARILVPSPDKPR